MSFENFIKRFSGSECRCVPVVRKELGVFGGQERRLGWQPVGGLVFASEFPSFDLAGFDVRLVERVDTNDGAGDGRGDFPSEKFLAEGVGVWQRDADNRLTCLF